MSNIPRARARLLAACDDLDRFWPKRTRKATATMIRQIIAEDMHKAPTAKPKIADPMFEEVEPPTLREVKP